MRGKGATVLTYGLIDLTGKTSENGQSSYIFAGYMDKTVGYDIGKLISGVANDWVTCRSSKLSLESMEA